MATTTSTRAKRMSFNPMKFSLLAPSSKPSGQEGGDKSSRQARSRTTSPKRGLTPPVSASNSTTTSPRISMEDDAPRPRATRINFTRESLPEYEGSYALRIDDVLSSADCIKLVKEAEATVGGSKGWEHATVTDHRNCGRIVWDSQAVVDKIWDRISHLPEIQEIMHLENNASVTGNGPVRRKQVWEFSRPNDHMRFLKYTPGEYFRPHCDGSIDTPDRKERSYFTMQLFLNDAGPLSSEQLRVYPKEDRKYASKEYLQGGNTTFHSWNGNQNFTVLPKAGTVLIYQHMDLLHSSSDVFQGSKYILRSDLMYKLDQTASRM